MQGKSNIRRHVREEHPDFLKSKSSKLVYQCNKCEYATIHGNHMKCHVERKHCNNIYSCHLCVYVRKSKAQLLRHIRETHTHTDTHKKCDKCKKKIRNEKFEQHRCDPITNYICNECGYSCKTRQNLYFHQKTVHEIVKKDHICQICGIGFYMKHQLTRHVKIIHEREKTQCPECGLKVKKLESHMKRIHTPDEKKKFQCQDCGKGFAQKDSFEAHRMSMHLKLRPHKCRYGCDMAYNDVSNRNQHEKRVHGKLFMTEKQTKEQMLTK